MLHIRTGYVAHFDGHCYTFYKPCSDEHKGSLIAVFEDAQGNIEALAMTSNEIKEQCGEGVLDALKAAQVIS